MHKYWDFLSLRPFFKWLPEILMPSVLCTILLFCSTCLVTAVAKQLCKMENLQNALESVCWECYPVVPNYCDQLAFSWKYLAFYRWLGWMLPGLWEVLAAVGGVTPVCGCFINESRGQRESTEGWSSPVSAHPLMMQEAVCLDSGCSRGFLWHWM